MELYINKLPKIKYKILNSIWTEISYGSPHIIGLLFSLIEEHAFPNWNKWEKYYFHSGELRIKLLQRLSENFKNRAMEPDKYKKKEISWPIYQVNYFHGRTEKELINIARSLFDNIALRPISREISLSDALAFVRFKGSGVPWNYSLLRYTRTVKILRTAFPKIQIKRAKIEFVDHYGFQGLITKNDKPRAGINVKSAGWLRQFNLLNNYIKELEEKVNNYKAEFGSDVFTFYSRLDGKIENSDEMKRLHDKAVKYII